jgi:hypothetical protein
MSAESAMKLVDQRQHDAHSRFERIRREMISHRPPTDAVHKDGD